MKKDLNIIKIAIGFDKRESVAYHTFCQSIIEKTSQPVAFYPLVLQALESYKETHTDGSNSFIYSRFLTPFLMDFHGWAIFADGDMVCREDIAKLWNLRDESKAIMCVKHDYKTKAKDKYLGNKNQDYPRKNWSSLVLWNCKHPQNMILKPDFVMKQSGAFLHRFTWLADDLIGEIPREWNWLATEYENNYAAKLIHFTLGAPCFKDYFNSDMAGEWHEAHKRSQDGMNV
jgi:lipopolysaccharide biosynthesis glycosyltransferase